MIELSRFGAYQVKMPLPFRLDHVNCYAFRGEAGWVLLDTGLNYGPTRQAWMEFMAEHGIRPEDIAGIYITHYHPDHYGAAGWLQEISGAPVYMSDVEISLAEKIWREDTVALMMEMLSENGVPAGVGTQIMVGVAEMRTRIKPHPRLTPLAAGETVHLGALRCRVLLTPGHSDGHVCFYDEENGFLFSGDHLLPRISSNISLWPRSHPDPLANFLASLAETSRLPAEMVLPAHGEYFAGVPGRVAELQAHHRERLELIRRIAS
ncbi:MAG: MBL fold metallo-hydrolase, partial [Desulfotomaculales bacterium]